MRGRDRTGRAESELEASSRPLLHPAAPEIPGDLDALLAPLPDAAPTSPEELEQRSLLSPPVFFCDNDSALRSDTGKLADADPRPECTEGMDASDERIMDSASSSALRSAMYDANNAHAGSTLDSSTTL